MRRAATSAVLLTAGLLTGCGSEGDPEPRPSAPRVTATVTPTSTRAPTPTQAPTPTPTPAPRTGTTVITADSPYGAMLYDATGQPIYLFDKERSATAQCYGACAAAWPPVLTKGLPQARKGTREALLGTTKRTDGQLQVTYAGHPLYYYAHEGKYQVLCHDVVEYGGTWLVVRPDGTPAPGR